jgi:Prenyltransferase and squalene oxidase repeat
VGVKAALAALALVLALPGVGATGVDYLQGRQAPGGGFAEPGGAPTAGLTAWAALGLRAAGASPGAAAARYLVAHEAELASATDLSLGILGERAAGADPSRLVARLRALERPSGAFGPSVNGTIWAAIALRGAGAPVPIATRRYLLARQSSSGGWSWARGVAPDPNDTAAAIEALRALGVRGKPIARGLRFLRRFQRPGGGFGLTRGGDPDSESTAWAIQAFVAAGVRPPPSAFAFLRRMRRPDGSYRHSARYVTTPVWVTAQVLPALARKAFPLG